MVLLENHMLALLSRSEHKVDIKVKDVVLRQTLKNGLPALWVSHCL